PLQAALVYLTARFSPTPPLWPQVPGLHKGVTSGTRRGRRSATSSGGSSFHDGPQHISPPDLFPKPAPCRDEGGEPCVRSPQASACRKPGPSSRRDRRFLPRRRAA